MRYKFNGELLEGNPIEIVEGIKRQAYDHERFKSLDDYMVWLQGSIWRFHGKGITIQSESLADRCRMLLDQLVAFELLEPVNACKFCGWPETEYVEEIGDDCCTKCFRWQKEDEEDPFEI